MTWFRSDINNWIIWIPNFKGYWEPKNISRVLASGVESNLTMSGAIDRVTIKVQGSYAYTRSLNYGDREVWGDDAYGKQLVYIPVHSGNVLIHTAWKGYYISFHHNSFSERYTTTTNDYSRRDWLYPYFMNDLSVGKEILLMRFNLSAELKISNMFDENYHSVLYRPMPGRNYMFTLTMKL